MAADRKRNILVSVLMHTHYGREALHGIFQHARTHADWVIACEGVPDPARIAAALNHWKCEGVIAQLGDPRTRDLITSSGIPAVDIGGSLASGFASVCPDNEAVGCMGAEHLLGRGLKVLAFCLDPTEVHARERERGFAQTMTLAGCRVRRFPLRAPKWYAEHAGLLRWLRRLPKPAGVMCQNDFIARYLMWACRNAGIRVPDEVALLGVDNDPFEGGLCDVPLSSVCLPAQLIGLQAARTLDGMLHGPVSSRPALTLAPVGVEVRQSTDVYAAADPLLVEVLRFIREHAHEPLHTAELLRRFAVSRRSLETRFRKAFGRSLGTEIRQSRLERARRLLTVTDAKLALIHAECGFRSSSTFSRLFRREVGMTLGQYRRQFRSSVWTERAPIAGAPAGPVNQRQ